jgi:hypothetical protein
MIDRLWGTALAVAGVVALGLVLLSLATATAGVRERAARERSFDVTVWSGGEVIREELAVPESAVSVSGGCVAIQVRTRRSVRAERVYCGTVLVEER